MQAKALISSSIECIDPNLSGKKALDLMKRLHATKCEQFNKEEQTYAYDTLMPIDKHGNKKTIIIDYGASNEKQDKKIVKLMNKLK